jgi:transposase
MNDFDLIRRMVLIDGLSRREVARRTGLSRDSVAKALQQAEPAPYTLTKPKARPVMDAVKPLLQAWLEQDRTAPRKQRHTAVRMFERLRDEYGFTGSRRSVSDLVRELRNAARRPEVFCPIEHRPGQEVQIDWGEAQIVLRGRSAKVMVFCARCAFSKATFVRAYLRDDMISFLDAHVWLFDQLGGVPARLAYDNLKTAVARVHRGARRDLTARFVALRSHYLFDSRFCNVARGNEKGHVENSVKRSERTYLTPVPQVASLAALNDHFVDCTRRDLTRVDAATGLAYGQLLEQERGVFRPLPPRPFLACTLQSLRVDRRSTVSHDRSRYSVPVAFATKLVVVRAFIERVEVLHHHEVIADHARVAPGEWSLQLPHYVALLEAKPGLLDSGKPFEKRAWTRAQQQFREELEYRYQGEGTRRFIDTLLLARQYAWPDVCRAIEACCRNHAFNEQAVLLELQAATYAALPPVVLDLSARPALAATHDGTRSLDCYDSLLEPRVELHGDARSLEDSFSGARNAHDHAPLSTAPPRTDDDRFLGSRSSGTGSSSTSAQAAGDLVGVCPDGATCGAE